MNIIKALTDDFIFHKIGVNYIVRSYKDEEKIATYIFIDQAIVPIEKFVVIIARGLSSSEYLNIDYKNDLDESQLNHLSIKKFYPKKIFEFFYDLGKLKSIDIISDINREWKESLKTPTLVIGLKDIIAHNDK